MSVAQREKGAVRQNIFNSKKMRHVVWQRIVRNRYNDLKARGLDQVIAECSAAYAEIVGTN